MDKQQIKQWIDHLEKYVEFHQEYRFYATLHKDDLLLSTGIASLSETCNDVSFVPELVQRLDAVLYGKVTLKLTKIGASINLKHSQEFLELSTEAYWIFERTP